MGRFLIRQLIRLTVVVAAIGMVLLWREQKLAENDRIYGDSHRRPD